MEDQDTSNAEEQVAKIKEDQRDPAALLLAICFVSVAMGGVLALLSFGAALLITESFAKSIGAGCVGFALLTILVFLIGVKNAMK